MNNAYYILRHGNSLANREGLIISEANIGTKDFGLTHKGQEDIKKSIINLIECGIKNKTIEIISSPFKRTKESALIAADLLGIKKILYNKNLGERFFGDLDGSPNDNYIKVWTLDKESAYHKTFGVESVNEVLSRTMSLIELLEDQYKNISIILVTHGDPAQILECGLKKIDPRLHRTLKPVEEGELRLLK